MPRTITPSRRRNHSRGQIVAARASKRSTRLKRIKNEPISSWYWSHRGPVEINLTWRYGYPAGDASIAELAAALGRELTPVVSVTIEELAGLPRELARSFFLSYYVRMLDHLDDRIGYHRSCDEIEWHHPEANESWRARENRRWRRDLADEEVTDSRS